MTTESEPLHWVVFFAIVATALAIDLFFVGRKGEVMKTRTAYAWSAVWISLGLGFSGLVYLWYGAEAAQQYLAGYLIEESLSIDNLFVFLLVFGSLGIALPLPAQGAVLGHPRGDDHARRLHRRRREPHRRASSGSSTSSARCWSTPPTGWCARTACRSSRRRTRWCASRGASSPSPPTTRGSASSSAAAARRFITPLAIALVAIESADLVFAIDSVPAVLAVSDITFVVFTSNIAAILGLRSLYFALAGSLQRFEYLSCGLAVVLGVRRRQDARQPLGGDPRSRLAGRDRGGRGGVGGRSRWC